MILAHHQTTSTKTDRRHRVPKKARALLAITSITGAAVTGTALIDATPAGAVTGYQVSWTGNDGLNIRSTPGGAAVGHLANSTPVDLACFLRGPGNSAGHAAISTGDGQVIGTRGFSGRIPISQYPINTIAGYASWVLL